MEGPVDEALAAAGADHGALQTGRELRQCLLCAEHPAELPIVRVDELGVVTQRRLAILGAVHHRPELVTQLDPEVEGGPDPLGGEGDAVPGGVADEEDPVLRPRPKLVRDPVALVADRRALQVVGQQHGGVLDVEAGIERADADALLVARWEAPAVTRRDVAAVDPDLEVLAAAVWMDLETA